MTADWQALYDVDMEPFPWNDASELFPKTGIGFSALFLGDALLHLMLSECAPRELTVPTYGAFFY